MTMTAYAFLQYRRLKTARREKKNQRAAAATDIARRAPGHPPTHRDHRRSDARAAENGFAAKSSVNKSAKVVLACNKKVPELEYEVAQDGTVPDRACFNHGGLTMGVRTGVRKAVGIFKKRPFPPTPTCGWLIFRTKMMPSQK
jgi:hypothetical protein